MVGDKVFRQIIFSLVPGLGPIYSRRILESMGSLEKVFGASTHDFTQMDGISQKGAEHILKSIQDPNILNRSRKELSYLESNEIKTFFIGDENYPYRLRQCTDAPVILYYQGKEVFNRPRFMAVVGSRKASSMGKKNTRDLLEGLRDYEIISLSGLAYGIDIEAHRSSLEFGIPTLGVLGHGLDNLYPSDHKNTSLEMRKQGGLITEFISGTPISPGLFPRRNRIIAGLCDALVIVEASEKGGALITAELAYSYDREVFALPGRLNDTYSQGCLVLIRDQKAQLILKAEDIGRFMNWEPRFSIPKQNSEMEMIRDSGIPLNSQEEKVFQFIIQNSKCSLFQLELEFKGLGSQIHEILLNLEITGRLRTLPGKLFEAIY